MTAAGWYPDPWNLAPLRWWDGEQWTGHVHEGAVQKPAGGLFDQLLGVADRVAVVDVETTGFGNSDRVIEVAVVTMDRHGKVVDEFETLLDPGRDLGPTWVHRITPTMVAGAPRFEEAAHQVAARLDGAVCAAHNLPFDRRMLANEFERVGLRFDWGVGLDTLKVTGCKLHVACADYGVQLDDAHRALSDARATAGLLRAVAGAFDVVGAPAVAGPVVLTPIEVRTRDGFTVVDVPAPYVASLAGGVHASADVAPYVDLLDAALADLRLTDEELDELDQLAEGLGLDRDARVRAHREFLHGLVDAAVDDSVVTDDEMDLLCRVAALLDIESDVVIRRVAPFRAVVQEVDLLPGAEVCFTGSAVEPDGTELPREQLERAAVSRGLVPVGSVRKRGKTILVAADPSSRSTKSRTARKYGLPIASVSDFLAAVSSGGPLKVLLPLTSDGVAFVCRFCGTSWMGHARSELAMCDECSESSPERSAPAAGAEETPRLDRTAAPATETLTCIECGADWKRVRARGRKPHRCPDCVGD